VVGGQKRVDYDAAIVCLYQYWIHDTDGAKDAWVAGQDALVDAIVAQIRTDPSFGSTNGATIFEAGNQDAGIQVARDMPHWDQGGGKIMAWFRVDFKVTQIVQA
jgi:hypothetical protein